MKTIGILCSALLLAGTAQAQVYKCVDGGGKTVYSQVPCPGNARSTTLKNSAPAPVAKAEPGAKGAPKNAADADLDFKKRKLEQDEAKKKQDQSVAQAKAKEENCRGARSRLALIEQGGRQVRIDDKGERYYLDDAQIEAEKSQARRAVESSCA
jgi:hypothetical protein